MSRCLYHASFEEFIKTDDTSIFGSGSPLVKYQSMNSARQTRKFLKGW